MASIFEKLKPTVKAAVPCSVWEWMRAVTVRSWLFGSIFTIFLRKYRVDGLVFDVPKELFPVPLRSAFLFGAYEQYEQAEVEALVKPNDAVVELGAAIGVLACVTNRMLSERTRHVVVEPHPEAIPYLYRNRKRNKAEFVILNSVISPNKVENFSFGEQLHESRVGQGAASARIPGITLSEINQKFGPFSVLIMDIEGAEKFVVQTESEAISGFRLVILELHPSHIGEDQCDVIRNRLASLGFSRVGEKSNVEAWVKDKPVTAPAA